MNKFIEIKSKDNTDTIIFIDKIQYILQKENGCVFGLDDGIHITSTASFKDVSKGLNKLIGGEK